MTPAVRKSGARGRDPVRTIKLEQDIKEIQIDKKSNYQFLQMKDKKTGKAKQPLRSYQKTFRTRVVGNKIIIQKNQNKTVPSLKYK